MRERNYLVLIRQRREFKLIGVVGSVKASTTGKTSTYYCLPIHFDFLKVMDENTFIVPLKTDETNIQYYITTDEI
jgi:hypothetical protein